MYKRRITRAVQLLSTCFKCNIDLMPMKDTISVVPGCGCVSLAIHSALEKAIDRIRHGDSSLFHNQKQSQLLKILGILERIAYVVPGSLARSCSKDSGAMWTRCVRANTQHATVKQIYVHVSI